MKNVIEAINSFFEKNEWHCQYDEEKELFISSISLRNALGNVKVFIPLGKDTYRVYVVINSKVEEEYYGAVGEFLHRVNYGLRNGNFEMDYRDGEIRYKTFVNCKDTAISEAVITDSIILGIAMCDKYGKGLLKLMLGEGTPKECVEECEKEWD